jgi:hypothetical protein
VFPAAGKNSGPYHVATRRNGDAVLVLVKAPALKSYNDDVRKTLLRQIADTLRADEQLKGKRIFIGIKGRLTYGAIQTPPDVLQIGSVIPDEKLYDFYGDSAAPGGVALAGSPPGGKENFPTKIPAQRSPPSGVADDADVRAEGLLHKDANRVEGERPVEEPRGRDEPEAAESSEDSTPPRAKTDDAQTATSQDDKAAARAKKKEDAQAGRDRQASKREMERAERKKRFDEQMAELKKRNDEQRAELKKRSDEQLATLKLQAAEAQRNAGAAKLYRKMLKEIVDIYPETEAGKKAAKLLK